MKYELKSIGIWSFVKISFFINLVFGAIFGFIYALFFGLIISLAGNNAMYRDLGVDPSEMSIGLLLIIFPIIFGIMGAFFQTLIMTILVGMYNLFTKLTGGLVLNLDLVAEPVVQAVPTATLVTNPVPTSTPSVQPLPPPPPLPVTESVKPVEPQAPPMAERVIPVEPTIQPEAPKPEQTPKPVENDPEDKSDKPPKW